MTPPPADCIAEKAPSEVLGAIHDPEVLDLVQDLQKRATRPLVLITGPSGVGKTTLVNHGLASRLSRFNNGFRHARISVKVDDTSSTLANRCIREIWRHHPDLNRHIVTRSINARKQRATLLELAETDPVRAGRLLFTILRGLEKGTTSRLRDVRFMLHIDGLERLYENRVGAGGNPFVPVFGPTVDPFGFIREILSAKSLLIVLGYRDWVRDSIRQALVRSKIMGNETLRYAVNWPTETRISAVITRTILESKIGGESNQASQIAAKLMQDFSKASPACAQHLQGVLATAGTANELDGYLSATAENYYQSLPGESQGGVARIVQRFSGGSESLPAREISNDPHLWNVATEMANGGLLCLAGNSLDTAEFSLISGDIFKSWERAEKWATESHETASKNVRQTDQFENHALSWDSTGRDSDLLLNVDQSLACARKLLARHAERPILSPLAFEFLDTSVKASRGKFRGRKFITTPITIASALVVVAAVTFFVAQYLNKPNPAIAVAPNLGLAATPKAAVLAPVSPILPAAAIVEAPAPVVAQKSKKSEPKTIAAPAPSANHLADDASLGEIVTQVEAHLAARKMDTALTAIYFLHNRTTSDPAPRITADQLRRLTVCLGKIAMLQGDQKGSKFGWKIGLSNRSRGKDALPDGLRLLMARTAANADRKADAATMLFGAGTNAEAFFDATKTILDLELGDPAAQNATLPVLIPAIITELPVSDAVKEKLRAVRR